MRGAGGGLGAHVGLGQRVGIPHPLRRGRRHGPGAVGTSANHGGTDCRSQPPGVRSGPVLCSRAEDVFRVRRHPRRWRPARPDAGKHEHEGTRQPAGSAGGAGRAHRVGAHEAGGTAGSLPAAWRAGGRRARRPSGAEAAAAQRRQQSGSGLSGHAPIRRAGVANGCRRPIARRTHEGGVPLRRFHHRFRLLLPRTGRPLSVLFRAASLHLLEHVHHHVPVRLGIIDARSGAERKTRRPVEQPHQPAHHAVRR